MEPKIKMIGLDLDGTLLTDKKELTGRTKAVIGEAIRRGIKVLVASGRPWMGVPEELRNFPGMRYALTSNGARIIDTLDDRIIEEHLLSPELALKALAVCGKYDTLQEVYFDGQGYAPADQMAHVEKYHRNPSMCEYMNIEINAAGVNKGTGLISLGRLLGIRREEIMAFGDGDNDIAMLKEAGVGVAMANAEEAVKAAADYITLSNEEEGVADAIEKLILNR